MDLLVRFLDHEDALSHVVKLLRRIDPGRAVLTAALELLDRPRDLYDTATDHARKLLNKAIFARLYVDMHPARQPTVATDDLHEPFGSLMHAIRATDTGPTANNTLRTPPTPLRTNQTHLGGLLASRPCGSECE